MEIIGRVLKRYDEKIVKVKGSRKPGAEIFAFTLSTCVWCNMGKKWLTERGYDYSYLDIDKIPVEEKNELKGGLKVLASKHPRFPFLILVEKNKWHSGYDPSAWEELLGD